MRLVQYDEKHQIIGEIMELGELEQKEKELLQNVLHWMNRQTYFFSGYNKLKLCLDVEYGQDDGERIVDFIGSYF